MKFDSEGSVGLRQMHTQDAEIVNNDGISQRWGSTLRGAAEVSVSKFEAMASVDATVKVPPAPPGSTSQPTSGLKARLAA